MINTTSIGGKTELSTPHPFTELRLSRSFEPSHYDIVLGMDVHDLFFHGSVDMTLHVKRSTKYIDIHRADLAWDISEIKVHSFCKPYHLYEVVNQCDVTENQIDVIKLEEELMFGMVICVSIGSYIGRLRQDLRGLSRSSCTAMEGNLK